MEGVLAEDENQLRLFVGVREKQVEYFQDFQGGGTTCEQFRQDVVLAKGPIFSQITYMKKSYDSL